jgi:hypothetical protein
MGCVRALELARKLVGVKDSTGGALIDLFVYLFIIIAV